MGETGPKERAWLAAGYAVLDDERARGPVLLLIGGGLPVAVLPSWGGGAIREAWIGYCALELTERRRGWPGMVARLGELGPAALETTGDG